MRRILAVDDDQTLLELYKQWIPEDLATVECASSAEDAAQMLRRKRYDLVLLDYSMDEGNPTNRDTLPIQKYLASSPDHTQYIVVSTTIDRAEVARAAFADLASFVILKEVGFGPEIVRDRVKAVLEAHPDPAKKLIAAAREKLVGSSVLETNVIAALSAGGVDGLTRVMNYVLTRIAPIAIHRHRPTLVLTGSSACALVWSRQLGTAVSFVMAKRSTGEQEALANLTDWLGYEEREPEFSGEAGNSVGIWCFREPSASEQHFDLPTISLQ